MKAPHTESLQTRIETLIALARLLDRVEASPRPIGADQYRAVVRQLTSALSAQIPEPALEAILGAHPGAAELYENLHYERSGLSRSTLDRSVATEMQASEIIHRASASRDGA
jgi:hypothetical protein